MTSTIEPYYHDEAAGITIYHGRCEDVLPTLDAATVDLVLTDPPYGMSNNCDYTRLSTGPRGTGGRSRRSYDQIEGDDRPFDPAPWLGFPRVILFGSNHFGAHLPVGTTLVWIKRFDGGFGSYLSDAEVAWMKGGHGVYCHRDTSMQSVGRKGEKVHPTQKPVGLMKWCIAKSKAPNDVMILDPFMGSGTTLLAAKGMGLRAIGIECHEPYAEIAAQRLSQQVLALGAD